MQRLFKINYGQNKGPQARILSFPPFFLGKVAEDRFWCFRD